MTTSNLPPEAAEADVLEQHAELRPEPDDLPLGGEPNWEADPADVAEQAWSVEDDEEYLEG
ncbi:MAG: hypothetical protein ACJ74U_19165 [Jatrophihabitantaceae bacterium]